MTRRPSPRSRGGRRRRRRGESRKPSSNSYGRRVARIGAGAALLGLVLAGGLFAWSFVPGQVLALEADPFHFEVETRDKGAVIDALSEDGHLASPSLTRAYVTLLTPFSELVPRSHLLRSGMSARALVRSLSEASSRTRVKVTFPEGWTHLDMAVRLQQNQICSELGFQAAVMDESFVRNLGIPAPSAEGYLFPARYELAVDSDPRDVVEVLVREAQARFSKLKEEHGMHSDLVQLGLGVHGVVTLASVVERETSLPEESPRVARVFLNRLLAPDGETKGRLQSDPTAAYGCRVNPMVSAICLQFSKKVTPRVLQDPLNPYNTYRHSGLPPGPISNPGEEAIAAVLAPAGGSALYFVADGSGGHTFSRTYEEHLRAVQRLKGQKKPKRN